MIIKKANTYDATNIARVHFEEWTDFYKSFVSDDFLKKYSFENRKKFWIRYISEGGVVYIVEEKTGDIVGFVVPKLIRLSYVQNSGEIMAHYVSKDYQRKGYGKLLLVSCAKFFLKNKSKEMSVWIHRENPAMGFYEHMGGIEKDVKIERMDSKNIVKLKLIYDDLEKLIDDNNDIFEGVIKEF